MGSFGHFASRLSGRPIAMEPRAANDALSYLLGRAGHDRPGTARPAAIFDFADEGPMPVPGRAQKVDPGYDVLPGGIARISIEGTLFQRVPWLRSTYGLTGYNGVRQSFLSALTDRRVKAIMLVIDSGGGEVSGCFDLCDLIYEARGRKPIWATLDENAFSAAYAIASSADKITVPRTGGVGSIGIISMHLDLSQMLESSGLKTTFIQYGDRKADGHAEIPLSEDALTAMQADVDAMGKMFDALVARNRGIPASKVRGMQAACYLGAPGVGLGLADAVMAPDAAFRALQASLA